ncbi:MAG: GTPase KRas precursor [Candidatus Heimdallarchaeota archaeon LC_2]|nr:MAG: GTPase KRas precursor [Candidatus Heimdallarchaeota archaeon LC_2]
MAPKRSIAAIKLVTFGDIKVGKTTLRLRYIGEEFRSTYVPTLGVDFAITSYKNYILQIWDIAGQETFQSVTEAMYKGAAGIIIVFDITNKASMINVPNWIESFLKVGSTAIPIVIFGNKIDLRETIEDVIQKSDAQEYIDILSHKYAMEINYIETSALTGENLQYAFNSFVDRIVKIMKAS